MKNQEGYQDRTAADAIANAEIIPKHIKEILISNKKLHW